MIIAWKAWYANKSHTGLETYTSTDTQFEDLPRDGCLGFVLFEDEQKPDGTPLCTPLAGYDWYFKSGEVYGCDNSNRLYEASTDIKNRYDDPIIIRGMWTTHDLHREMQNAMRGAECP